MRKSLTRFVPVLLLLAAGWGCDLVEPTCLDEQKRGTVTTIQGDVDAGQIVSHLVQYGTEGSQNEVALSWIGLSAANGPRIAVYATYADCVDFRVGMSSAGPCSVLGHSGFIAGQMTTGFIIANGRGNPEILGSPPEFKLWVVADPLQTASYTIQVTWFYGPDC